MHVHKRRLLIFGVGMVVIAVAVFALAGRFDVQGRMNQMVEIVRDAGPVPFFAAMAVLPAAGFPLSAFTFVAGPVFGPVMGLFAVILCAILAITINVALSYWLASRAMRPVAKWVVRRLGYQLPEVQPKAAWLAIVILRTVPVTPFFLQSVLLGLARVPFGAYMLVSVVVPSAYAVAIITLGDALMRGDGWAIAVAAALFIVVGVILHVMRKRLKIVSPANG